MQSLELAVQSTCEGEPENEPPPAPVSGQAFLCGPSPSGDWLGRANALALWTDFGWRFCEAFEGFKVVSLPSGVTWQFVAGQWQPAAIVASELRLDGQRVLGPRLPPIADISGGSVADLQAREVIAGILTALRQHGLIDT